jgi:predicted DCC family thiol-disulfide oxidoreductase YuxK
MNTTTVFYDGGCPLCSREIAHYRRMDREHRIRWLDVTRDGTALSAYGIDQVEALAVFHVIDRGGRLVKGAEGFVTVWKELPRYRWLARLCRFFHLLPLMEWGYARFARWHFRRRCREGVCG